MQQAAWARACLAALTEPTDTPHLVVAGEGVDAAIAPLVERGGAFARLELAGLATLQEPMDFVYRSAAAVAPLARTLARCGLPVVLGRVPAGSPVVPALSQAYRGRALVHVRQGAPAPWIPLDPTWAEPKRHFEGRRRYDLRRARRCAEQQGPVQSEILSPTPCVAAKLLDQASTIEASGWKRHTGTALTVDRCGGDFFRRYALEASERGVLRVCFLRIGGTRVAMQLAAECAGASWLLKIGYDERFGRCSPGTLLMLETVRYAAARGLRAYELTGAAEPWTAVWKRQEHPMVSVRVYPPGRDGLAAFATDVGRRLARRLRRCT